MVRFWKDIFKPDLFTFLGSPLLTKTKPLFSYFKTVQPFLFLLRYELAHPDDTAALLTKDLDKFDMVVQAFEYEEKEKRFGDLEDFFRSTSSPELFKNPIIKMWDTELRIIRKSKVLEKTSVIGNDNGES